MKAPFGWTVISRTNSPKGFFVYKRDVPADEKHFAADLAPFTHSTKKEAEAAGVAGNVAYRGRA